MSIYEKLYDWQKTIIDKYKSRRNFGLFLDCGTGKTPISLAFAEVNKCNKIIIITINSKATEDENVSGSWLNWALKSNIKYNFKNKEDNEFSISENDILLINYEALYKRGKEKPSKSKMELKDNIVNFLKSCKTNNVAIIVDESHKLKNLQSQQTLAINKIQRLANIYSPNVYTYLLTGTPFTTGYIDLYSQLKILGYDCNKSEFINNYCIVGHLPGLLGWQQPIIGYKNVNDLYDLIHKYAITIKSEDVIKLPEKIFINHISKKSDSFNLLTLEKINDIYFNNYIRKYRKDILDTLEKPRDIKINNKLYRNLEYPSDKWFADTAGSFWLRARQISIGFQGNADDSKWYNKDRLKDLRKLLEESPNNYVLFYNYTPELLEIYQICEELGYNIDVYCGEVKSLCFYEKYEKQTEEEKLTNKKNVIISNFASGSTGKNWQQYNQCILFSIPLYKDYEQAIKRINRTGQKETTFYHLFYQDNWLDKGMLKSLEENKQYSSDMFTNDLLKNLE